VFYSRTNSQRRPAHPLTTNVDHVHASIAQDTAMHNAQAHTKATTRSNTIKWEAGRNKKTCKETQNFPSASTRVAAASETFTHWQPLQSLSSPANLAAAAPVLHGHATYSHLYTLAMSLGL